MTPVERIVTPTERRARMRRNARAARERAPLDERASWEEPASATDAWRDDALEVVRTLAVGRASLTVEDVAPRVPSTYDRRALGAVMLAAARRGWLFADGWQQGDAPRHGRPIRRWRSRLYKGPGP